MRDVAQQRDVGAVGVEGRERLLSKLPVNELERHVEALAQQRRERRGGRETGDAHASGGLFPKLRAARDRAVERFESRFRTIEKQGALLRERVVVVAIDQLQAKLAFEVRDMGAQGRFRDEQLLSGFAETQMSRKGDELLQIFGPHRRTAPCFPGYRLPFSKSERASLRQAVPRRAFGMSEHDQFTIVLVLANYVRNLQTAGEIHERDSRFHACRHALLTA